MPATPPLGESATTWRQAFTSRWALLSLAALLYWIASHSLRPFVVLRLDTLGASAQEVGLVAAAYASLALLLAIPGGRAIDRLGSTRVLYGSLIAMVGIGAAYAFADTIPQLFALQMINGVVELGVWLSLQTLASHAGTGDVLARQLSMFSFAWGLGIAIGPTVGGLVYESIGFPGLAFTYSALAAGILIAMWFAPAGPAGMRARGGGLGRDARQTARQPAIRSVLLSSFVAMYIISIKNTFYPLSLEERGITETRIGVLLSIMGVASLGVRVLVPMLLRRFGPRFVLVVGTSVGVVGISLTPWMLHPVLLVAAAVFTGAGYGSNPPVAMQLLGEHSAESKRGLVMGLRAASTRLAQVLQPLVFGSLAAAAGTGLAFPISGVILAAMTLRTRRDLRALSSRPGAG
ncbi:MAG: MFS transporter [Propionibacteriales bacterium]|nr:MFS transporter [Propionibacteriales bacterium]